MKATTVFEVINGTSIGIPVVDAVGEKVGRARWADSLAIIVERGRLFHTQTEIYLDEVDRYQDGLLILKRTKAEVLGRAA